MLVSHKSQFIFTKTARTAGISVEMLFEPFCLADENEFLTEARPKNFMRYRN